MLNIDSILGHATPEETAAFFCAALQNLTTDGLIGALRSLTVGEREELDDALQEVIEESEEAPDA